MSWDELRSWVVVRGLEDCYCPDCDTAHIVGVDARTMAEQFAQLADGLEENAGTKHVARRIRCILEGA